MFSHPGTLLIMLMAAPLPEHMVPKAVGPASHLLSPPLTTPSFNFRQRLSFPIKNCNIPGTQLRPTKISASFSSLWTMYTWTKGPVHTWSVGTWWEGHLPSHMVSRNRTYVKLDTPILLAKGHFFKSSSCPSVFFY